MSDEMSMGNGKGLHAAAMDYLYRRADRSGMGRALGALLRAGMVEAFEVAVVAAFGAPALDWIKAEALVPVIDLSKARAPYADPYDRFAPEAGRRERDDF